MRLAVLAVIVTGCASHTAAVAAPSPAAAQFAAARWVPAQPTYVFASNTLGGAQRSLRDALDVIGLAVGFELRDASQAVSDLIGVDALHPDPVAAIGIDPRGGWAAFSDDLSPTLVVRLAAPDRMAAFLDRQRERGMTTESVIVAAARGRERTEVVSARLINGLKISWAIAGDWMWVHVALPSAHDDGTSWFTASHDPHPAGWSTTWAWAQRAAGAAAGVVGFLDLHSAVANAAAALPDAVACAKQIPALDRVAVAIEGDERHVAVRLAVRARSTASLTSLILPPPSGWAATAARAALAAQWNLDLPAVRSWLAPCLASAGVDLSPLDDAGVRAGRGLVLDFDPDQMSGTGAIALDVTRPAFFERQLDRIPLRHTLERMRTFGTTPGVQIAIPFGVTLEYVLDDHRAVAALGDGMLARVFAPAAGAPGAAPVVAIDLAPPAMSVAAWGSVLHALIDHQLSGPPGAEIRRTVDRLMRWRDLHFGVTVEPSELVVSLSGHRR